MNELPELTTARLHLRIPGPEDAGEMLRFYRDNRDHLQRWAPATPPDFYTVEYWQERLAKAQRDCLDERTVSFVFTQKDMDPGRIIGRCILGAIVRDPLQNCQLGYGLDRAMEGKGFMTEALAAVIEFAFQNLKLHRIEATYSPQNARSGAVLKRLGFAVEGFARDYLLVGGTWQDHLRAALVNPLS